MQEIKCPKCGEVFQVDESGYAAIASQVRDKEFQKEVQEKKEAYEAQKKAEIEVAEEKLKRTHADEIHDKNQKIAEKDAEIEKKNAEINQLTNEIQAKIEHAVHEAEKKKDTEIQEKQKALLEKEKEIERMMGDQAVALLEKDHRIESLENERAAAIESEVHKITEAKNKELAEKDKEISDQKLKIAEMERDSQQTLSNKEQEISKKNQEIERLNETRENDIQIAIYQVTEEKNKEIFSVTQQLNEKETQMASMREAHNKDLQRKDEEINFYKDFKARQSTKMVGESLEVHCETEFNKLRATAFQHAYFEKDNDARGGSKGDFIYREETEDGVEIISIMFEMKNEMDTTATKHRNEDFFKELDKDRREKNCEYAVLVSLLEADSDYYNSGIVDVSHKYPKMYVVRPQFFIPIITVLRNAALNSVKYREEMERVKNMNIDITHFEDNIEKFKNLFEKHCANADTQFNNAIKEIDNAITNLQEVKEALRKSMTHYGHANSKLDDLTIKKLTKGNPTMLQAFADLKNDHPDD